MLYNLIAFSAAAATGAADEDCVGYHYKINGVCTGVQQFPGATGCGTANGGKDTHPIALDKAFCEEFGTARVPADQQISMVSWGNLGKSGAARYDGEVNDPNRPSGCVTHASQNIYQWNNAPNGPAAGWWRPVCMEDVQPATPPTSPPSAPQSFTKCKDYTLDRAMSVKNGADGEAVQLCKVINGNVMSPMWGNGKDSDCGTNSLLISSSTDSIADCQALCDAHNKCVGWQYWDQNRLDVPRDDQGCYLFEHGTADQLVPDRIFGDNSAVAAGVCFPEPRTFNKCKEYTPDRAMSIKNGANSEAVQLCKVINGNVMSPMWDNGKASDCGTDAGLISASTNSIEDCQALCDAHPLCLGWWMWDQTRNVAPNNRDDQGCYLFEQGTADQLVPDRVFGDNSAVAAGVCFPEETTPPTSAQTNPPSTAQTSPPICDCRQTALTYDEGARCMGPMGESIGYRKTANWCCSEYGCSKGYSWVNPADSPCLDDNFVGTCMFNFIQAGGCDVSNIDSNAAIQQAVDPACFECPNIGEMVDQECMGGNAPLKILNDMIDDARRLEQAPLPAGDDKLYKINRKISKIRTILKQTKLASRAAMTGSG